MTKRQDTTASESLITDSAWIEGNISIRKGNRNIILIAPHGHERMMKKLTI